MKSEYCTKNAAKVFEELVDSIQAKYILLSYNNMADKGDSRSNAKISDDDIYRILCICGMEEKKIIPSALNYTGGKFKLLSQLLPHFPRNIDKAVDLFCGGCNVGINLKCEKVVFNDSDEYLIGLLNTLRTLDK